ncbi:Rha family transcriptional regulator [Salmonella enterica]|nr:Rha family transcriptional regulator [Salmonella enterica]
MAMKTQVTTTEKPVMMSSQEIAELTGKRPANVIRDIWVMLESLYSVNKDSSNLSHHKNQQVTVTDGVIACFDNRGYVSEFLLDRRHTEILITGYDVKRRAAIIDRWFTLEKKSYQPVDPIAALNDPEFLRGTLLGYTEKVIALEHKVAEVSEERDKAIRTKSQISNKREASALGKLSAARRRCRMLEEQLGESVKHATIIKVENATGRKGEFTYLLLRRWCKENGVLPESVPDERYGSVKAWPADAWLAVYGIDLKSLFGEKK